MIPIEYPNKKKTANKPSQSKAEKKGEPSKWNVKTTNDSTKFEMIFESFVTKSNEIKCMKNNKANIKAKLI